jgi:hypothetical protein
LFACLIHFSLNFPAVCCSACLLRFFNIPSLIIY